MTIFYSVLFSCDSRLHLNLFLCIDCAQNFEDTWVVDRKVKILRREGKEKKMYIKYKNEGKEMRKCPACSLTFREVEQFSLEMLDSRRKMHLKTKNICRNEKMCLN